MTILICPSTLGGCGFVGHDDEFKGTKTVRICPVCKADHSLKVTEKMLETLGSHEKFLDFALLFACHSPRVLRIVDCRAKCEHDRIEPCVHDVQKARRQYARASRIALPEPP